MKFSFFCHVCFIVDAAFSQHVVSGSADNNVDSTSELSLLQTSIFVQATQDMDAPKHDVDANTFKVPPSPDPMIKEMIKDPHIWKAMNELQDFTKNPNHNETTKDNMIRSLTDLVINKFRDKPPKFFGVAANATAKNAICHWLPDHRNIGQAQGNPQKMNNMQECCEKCAQSTQCVSASYNSKTGMCTTHSELKMQHHKGSRNLKHHCCTKPIQRSEQCVGQVNMIKGLANFLEVFLKSSAKSSICRSFVGPTACAGLINAFCEGQENCRLIPGHENRDPPTQNYRYSQGQGQTDAYQAKSLDEMAKKCSNRCTNQPSCKAAMWLKQWATKTSAPNCMLHNGIRLTLSRGPAVCIMNEFMPESGQAEPDHDPQNLRTTD